MTTILFLHGWQSVPGGVKPTYLKDHGHEVINPALPDDDIEEAIRIAQAEFDKHQPQVVVGSSRGGAVAMNIGTGEAQLVLLCPAWKKYGTAKTVKPDTVILHSRADDVVPFADSEELVRNSGLRAWTLIEVGNDHPLADPDSLDMMLEACLVGKVDEEDEGVQEEESGILERDWTGLCYTAALQWVREEDDQDWVVVHGTVWSETLGKRIEHAWCECEGVVVDLALPVGERIIVRERYYRSAQPQVSKVYSSENARLLAIKNRHDGPWDESEQIREQFMDRKPTVRIPVQGRTVAVVGDVYRFLATGEDTNGKYAVWEAIVPPGGGPPPHVHSREEEGFYILEGEITFTVNGERIVAKTGTFANMPVGTPHSFKNESERPAKMLLSVAPAGLEQMFFEVGVPLAEGATTASPPTKEEIEKLLAIAPKYGIEIKMPGH